jgi:phosphoglycerate kinase
MVAEKKMYKITDFNFKDRSVFVRVDFNVPIKNGKIQNDERIKSSLKTIEYILKKKPSKIILASHLGRPKGEVNLDFSLEPVSKRLSDLLSKKINFISDCISELPVDNSVSTKNETSIYLLENLRFYKEEKKNDAKFAKKILHGCDYYVNDAFGTSHRKHASVCAITKYVKSSSGCLLNLEISNLTITNPKRPFAVILGGAKVSDKIGVISNLIKKADVILLGGAMIFTFYKSQGLEIGNSLVEDDKLDTAIKLLKKAKSKIVLPTDIVVANSIDDYKITKNVSYDNIPKNMIGLDIGKETIDIYSSILSKTKTIVWNGPMGMFEINKFAKGTNEIAKFLSSIDSKTIIGGGDSVSAIEKLGVQDKIYHISTGGGASLEMLEGKTLPAIKSLEDSYKKFSKHI